MKLILIISLLLFLIPHVIAETNQTIAINLKLEECQITINTNKEIYEPKEQIEFYNNISIKNNFTIKYYIINKTGTIKNPVITKNLNKKYFTPKETKAGQTITIISELQTENCEISAEKSIIIKGNPNLIDKTAASSPAKTQKTTASKTFSSKASTAKNSSKTTSATQKTYEITPLDTTEMLLNQETENKPIETTTFVSNDEKAGNFAKYALFGAIFLFVIGIKSNGNKNKNHN